ncbi:transcriptional regulator with XRE-family HTH domain [Nocardia transvalensis]|uniref:Transcriptional regulator with XRE-family HTH domain n=1 Tax=Nocardia transvalensis TaxID=37333 RepID=A0A7W9PKU9_9NOCA|nr:helix-turn-helix transcriptional regulator [Nocardia transvalensis]MBB5918071.1 transcriptional regulator with XRE-family HTH domain [Nocardia transvalensis]
MGDSSITRRQLGRMLREAREAIGLTLDSASRLLDWSKSTLQRYEKGQNQKIRDRDLDAMIDIYRIDPDHAEALRGLAKQAAEKSWWHEFGDLIPANFSVFMGLESAAERLTTYQPDLVPGLLQTASYARVLARLASPGDTDEECERRIEMKMRRQHLITRRIKPTQLTVILGETVLHRVIGSGSIMTAQLKHLADIGTRPNVSVRILPFASGMPTGELIGTFVILEFPEDSRGEPIEPTIVYAENYTGDMYSEKMGVVRRYSEGYERIQRVALDEVCSRTLLRKVAREYQRER